MPSRSATSVAWFGTWWPMASMVRSSVPGGAPGGGRRTTSATMSAGLRSSSQRTRATLTVQARPSGATGRMCAAR
ncbi:hypothetical protein P0M04_30280 [Telluria mixta]|uniref:hypothetical protein n=1 Tax=Telluria mixta TaxID=34071 RepID=UPI00247AD907|nr:hypothetical protein [Telluria mixta]WEM95709.1 hypothetical protein P0M04_30280 [Telluria mixta]